MPKDSFHADLEQLKKEIWYIKKIAIPELQSQGGGGNSSEITSLADRITALENASNTESIDVIYDMRSTDPDINKGWTTGATTGKIFRMDFTKYKSIRLYAYLNACDTQLVFKVANRKSTTIPMMSFNLSSYNALHILKITLLSNGQTLQIGGWATYSYDLNNNNSLTVNKSTSSNVNYYVYRIEGIY